MEYELLQTILKAFENCHFNCLSTYLPLLPYSCFLYLMVQTIVWLNAYKCLLPFFKVINCSPFLKTNPLLLRSESFDSSVRPNFTGLLNIHDYKRFLTTVFGVWFVFHHMMFYPKQYYHPSGHKVCFCSCIVHPFLLLILICFQNTE